MVFQTCLDFLKNALSYPEDTLDDQKKSKKSKFSPPKAALFAAIGLTVGRSLYCYVNRKYNKYPPGPMGIPFLGSLLWCFDIPKYAAYLASNYGPISMIYIGRQRFVFLHSTKYINEIFRNPNATEREWDHSLLFLNYRPNELPTVFSSNKYWKNKRKIFQSIMLSRLNSTFINKTHNKSLKSHVFSSIDQTIKENKLWFPFEDIHYVSFHFIWNALFGSYISYHSAHTKHVTVLLENIQHDVAKDILLRYSGLKHIVSASMANALLPYWMKCSDYLEQQIYKQLDYDENVFDMKDKKWAQHFENVEAEINSCVAAKLLATHRNHPTPGSCKKTILSELVAFFAAGVDTTMHASEYGVILLAKYPLVQEEIFRQLSDIFGADWEMKEVNFNAMIIKAHLLRAFLYELLRISCVAPIGASHYNPKCDIWLENKKYVIPKNSVIVSDVCYAHKCDPHWLNATNGNPLELDLNLWLDENNKFAHKKNRDKLMAFGIGQRDCAGQAMAKRSLYLLFLKLILNYKFNLAEKDKNIRIKQRYEGTFRIDPKIGVTAAKRK